MRKEKSHLGMYRRDKQLEVTRLYLQCLGGTRRVSQKAFLSFEHVGQIMSFNETIGSFSSVLLKRRR